MILVHPRASVARRGHDVQYTRVIPLYIIWPMMHVTPVAGARGRRRSHVLKSHAGRFSLRAVPGACTDMSGMAGLEWYPMIDDVRS